MTIPSVDVTAKAVASVGVRYATANASDKEIAEFFDWCVERGAEACEGVVGYNRKGYVAHHYPSDWNHFGADRWGNTSLWCGCDYYTCIVDTIEEAKDIVDPSWRKQEQKEEEMTDEQKAKKRVLEIVEKVLDGDILYCGHKGNEGSTNYIQELYNVVWRGTYPITLKSEIEKEKQEKEAKRNDILSQIASLQQQLADLERDPL